MARRDASPNFIEAIARGADVLRVLGARTHPASLAEIARDAELARPTTSRILFTLEAIGYVRQSHGRFALTPKVLELGLSYVQSTGVWDIAAAHLEDLVVTTGESCSIGQLDGSDTVYVARVAVPKIITIAVQIGTRFPGYATALGQVLMSELVEDHLSAVLATPSQSGVEPRWRPSPAELRQTLAEVRTRGWALTDEHFVAGVRSIAAPIRDSDGHIRAAINIASHAAETEISTILDRQLPRLLATAEAISADWIRREALPLKEMRPDRS